MAKRGTLITIGSFDGIHLGHQALIRRAIDEARKRRLKSLALTFVTPPRMVLDPKNQHRILSNASEKEFLLKTQGIDLVKFFEFDKKAALMKPFTFFKNVLLEQLGAKGVVVGADFRFGAGRSAGALELVRWGEEFEIPIWVISGVRHQRKIVSSSLIRQLLDTNHFQQALGFLGHPYLIEGRVVPGRQVGRKLGFPTANLKPAAGKILPRGVFVVRADRFYGVCNIGVRPTLLKKSEVVVEVHLFGRPPALEGKTLRVELLHRLRNEKAFDGFDALKRAIAADVTKAKRFLAQINALN